jgi:hypothetical protein
MTVLPRASEATRSRRSEANSRSHSSTLRGAGAAGRGASAHAHGAARWRPQAAAPTSDVPAAQQRGAPLLVLRGSRQAREVGEKIEQRLGAAGRGGGGGVGRGAAEPGEGGGSAGPMLCRLHAACDAGALSGGACMLAAGRRAAAESARSSGRAHLGVERAHRAVRRRRRDRTGRHRSHCARRLLRRGSPQARAHGLRRVGVSDRATEALVQAIKQTPG